MRRHGAIALALGLGLMVALGADPLAGTPLVGAEERSHGPGHVGAPPSTVASSPADVRQQGGIRLDVNGLNNSGITGTVTLRPLDGNRTEVDIRLDGAGAGPLPVHFHAGRCVDLNPVPDIPLATIANGASTTVVDSSLQQLASTPYVVFMHKSPDELPIFVACSDMAIAGRVSALPSAGEADPMLDLAIGLASAGLIVAGIVLVRRARRERPLVR
jgi:hypothetical protein